ncbi:MAG: hypothetical protein GY730_02310 [bacterium]|nr:hypothetical protein [bacterium]
MNIDFLKYSACPKCKNRLIAYKADNKESSLLCTECNLLFKFENGIARLLIKSGKKHKPGS